MMRSKARRPEIALDDFVGSAQDEGKRFSELISDVSPSPSEPLEIEEENKIVRGLVETMPEHLREVLVLGYFHHFPYKEMADILEIPLGTVKSRLHAAVAHFGQCYRTELDRRKRRNKIA
jgi:RNA polymerase sigma-70 factor (ECF subfamily)